MNGESTFNKKMKKSNFFVIYLSKNINIHKRKTFIFYLNVNYYILHYDKNEPISVSV